MLSSKVHVCAKEAEARLEKNEFDSDRLSTDGRSFFEPCFESHDAEAAFRICVTALFIESKSPV